MMTKNEIEMLEEIDHNLELSRSLREEFKSIQSTLSGAELTEGIVRDNLDRDKRDREVLIHVLTRHEDVCNLLNQPSGLVEIEMLPSNCKFTLLRYTWRDIAGKKRTLLIDLKDRSVLRGIRDGLAKDKEVSIDVFTMHENICNLLDQPYDMVEVEMMLPNRESNQLRYTWRDVSGEERTLIIDPKDWNILRAIRDYYKKVLKATLLDELKKL